jgi:ferredoxin
MCRAKLRFAQSGETATAPVGTRLLELSEEVETGIVYGCRQGRCGQCMVEVVDGEAGLSPPSVMEIKALEHFEAGARSRLACQVRIVGDVVLRPRPPI